MRLHLTYLTLHYVERQISKKIMILSSAQELCTGQTLNFKMLPLHMIYHNVLSTLLCLAKV